MTYVVSNSSTFPHRRHILVEDHAWSACGNIHRNGLRLPLLDEHDLQVCRACSACDTTYGHAARDIWRIAHNPSDVVSVPKASVEITPKDAAKLTKDGDNIVKDGTKIKVVAPKVYEYAVYWRGGCTFLHETEKAARIITYENAVSHRAAAIARARRSEHSPSPGATSVVVGPSNPECQKTAMLFRVSIARATETIDFLGPFGGQYKLEVV